jgi:hypothetical protein
MIEFSIGHTTQQYVQSNLGYFEDPVNVLYHMKKLTNSSTLVASTLVTARPTPTSPDASRLRSRTPQ